MVNMISKGSCFANEISISDWKKEGHGSSEIKQRPGGTNSSLIIQNIIFGWILNENWVSLVLAEYYSEFYAISYIYSLPPPFRKVMHRAEWKGTWPWFQMFWTQLISPLMKLGWIFANCTKITNLPEGKGLCLRREKRGNLALEFSTACFSWGGRTDNV